MLGTFAVGKGPSYTPLQLRRYGGIRNLIVHRLVAGTHQNKADFRVGERTPRGGAIFGRMLL